jgi:outer membrane murein-binding lipoprotein Lpp
MQYSTVRKLTMAGVLVIAATCGGCASMSKDECIATDWTTVGYEDGVAGYSGNRIAQHRKACAKHGVAPDLSAYQSGRNSGLREFCVAQNGFRVGARGASYNGVCPADLESAFLGAYETGRELNRLRAQVNNTANRISSLRNEIDNLDRDLIATAAEIMKPETTLERRAQLALDTRNMAERRGEARTEIPRLEDDLAHYRRELADFRVNLAYVE